MQQAIPLVQWAPVWVVILIRQVLIRVGARAKVVLDTFGCFQIDTVERSRAAKRFEWLAYILGGVAACVMFGWKDRSLLLSTPVLVVGTLLVIFIAWLVYVGRRLFQHPGRSTQPALQVVPTPWRQVVFGSLHPATEGTYRLRLNYSDRKQTVHGREVVAIQFEATPEQAQSLQATVEGWLTPQTSTPSLP